MFGLSPFEIIVILVVLVLLFGSRKLPALGEGLGKAIFNFRKSFSDSDALDVTPEAKEEKEDK